MQSLLHTNLINLQAAALNKFDELVNYITDLLNNIAQYLRDNGGLVNVTEYWGREFGFMLGGALGRAFGILLIWAGVLLSLILLSVVQLGVMGYQFLQPKLLRLWDKEQSEALVNTPSHEDAAAHLNKSEKIDS